MLLKRFHGQIANSKPLKIFTKKTWKPFFNKIMVNVITDAYVVVAWKNEPWKLFFTSTPNSTKILPPPCQHEQRPL